MKAQTYASNSEISAMFKHSLRRHKTYRNKDIDLERSKENYIVGPERNDPYTFYKERLSQVYCYNRKDVKTLCEWIVSLPKDTPLTEEHAFFTETYNYLTERFCNGNTNNVPLAIVHKDEKIVGGEPRAHMHYFFLPITEDKKHVQGEKICKKAVMPRSSFTTIHPELQEYLRKKGIHGTVHSGITAEQRRDYTIEEIKSGVRDQLETQYSKEKQIENNEITIKQQTQDNEIWDYSSHVDQQEESQSEESWF